MAISEDTGNQPVAAHTSAATTVTTAAFTPQAGTLLVAMIATDGPTASPTTAAITDSISGVWTLLKRQNSNAASTLGGTAEVWCRYLAAAPGSMTVTGTWTNGSVGGNLVVRSLLGAASTQPGVIGGNGGLSIAPTVTVVPTVVGSRVYGMIIDGASNVTLTANAQSVIIDQDADATIGDTWTSFKGAADVTSLVSTTYGFTDGNSSYNIAVAEILPAGGTVTSPAPPDPLFLPVDSPLYGLAPWFGAPDDATHNVIVNAGVATISFLSPATRPMMLLALTSETGPGATAITVPDPDVQLDPLLTPDDVTGGMQPWSGAPDGIAAVGTTANAGVASVSFTAQAPSASLAALPGTGSITLAAQAPTAAVGALPGAAAVTLVAQAPAAGLASLPGAAAVSFTGQAPVPGVAPTAGAATVTFTGRSSTVSLAVLPGAASLTLTAQAPAPGVTALPDTAIIALAAQGATGLAIDGIIDPSPLLFLPDDPMGGMLPWAGAPDGIITGDATVNAGVATITFAGQAPVPALAPTAGTASVSFAAQGPSAGLAALPATGSITFTANGPTAAVTSLPGTATVSLVGRAPVAGVAPTAGAASVSFAAQGPSASLAALPGTGSIAFAASGPTAAIGALPGAAAVSFTGRSATGGVTVLPGASSITFTASGVTVPGATTATAGVASISFVAQAPVPGLGAGAGAAGITFTAPSASVRLAALPGASSITFTAPTATVVLPQLGTPTLISGREAQGQLSGRESITSASGTETGPISGRQPLSSTSGTEAPTTIKGRES